jgi:hypothetical protein
LALKKAGVVVLSLALTAAIVTESSASRRQATQLSFTVFAQTGIPLADVTWTGASFLYATENLGQIYSGPPEGLPVTPFVSLPRESEEYRCAPSPRGHGFAGGAVYCHAPHGNVYRISASGTVSVFAKLPETGQADGAIAFDTAGSFGHALLVATGGSSSSGGRVYAIGPNGRVRRVGAYPGPGGADGIELAPRRFGSVSNQLLIAIDRSTAGKPGRVLAMSPSGRVRVLARIPEGINPIVAVGRGAAPRGSAAPGLYLTDTNSTNIYFATAASLRAFVGSVIVGSETSAHFWVVRPAGKAFRAVPVSSNLGAGNWNLEGGDYVA